MMQEKKIFQPLTSNDVCLVYELLNKHGFVSFPLTKEGRNKVESLIATINYSYFGKEIYETVEEKAVAYIYLLIKDHPFTDGNKRTSALIFQILCEQNGLKPIYDEYKLDELAVYIEKIRDDDHHRVIKELANLVF